MCATSVGDVLCEVCVVGAISSAPYFQVYQVQSLLSLSLN